MQSKDDSGSFRNILNAFFANFPFMLRIFFVCVVVSVLVPVLSEQKYLLNGEIMVLSKKIAQGNREEMGVMAGVRYVPVSLTDMETENNILRSLPVIKKTVEELYNNGLFHIERSYFDERVVDPLKGRVLNFLNLTAPSSMVTEGQLVVNELTKLVIDSLSISTIPGSNIIRISYETENPEVGSIFVNTLMDNYLAKRQELIANESPVASFLKKRDVYKERIKLLEKNRVELLNSHGITNSKEELSQVLQNINKEFVELNQLSDTLVEQRSWLAYIDAHLATLNKAPLKSFSLPYSFDGSGVSKEKYYVDTEMKQQIGKIAALQTKYSTVLLSFRHDTDTVAMISKELLVQKKRLINLVNNRVLEKSESVKVLESAIRNKELRINGYKERANTLNGVTSLENEINLELTAVNDTYFRLNQVYEEMRSKQLSELDDFSNVKILSRATIPLEPSTPSALFLFALSIFVSIVIAMTMGLLREYFDRRFRYPEQALAELGVPTVAVYDDSPSSATSSNSHITVDQR